MTVYDFTVKDARGNDVSLKEYEGQVLLINNSATRCGFTPQYDQLEDLYEMYRDQGFTILDFPCNQFANQAPESMEEIITFCDATYGIRFPIFEKIDVNGENEEPLYRYLKSQKGFEGFDMEHELAPMIVEGARAMDPDYEKSSDIKWNFTKFLINKSGEVVARFEPTADLLKIEEAVDVLVRE
ncbi:MAG: glutathione peroxidase [Lachnospiraceae bacterium]|nr:glutathione peroxidase [Lachnospiraceae bacterium]